MTADRVPGIVTRLLFTTQRRCARHPNPRRPTWRCRRPPTWLWLTVEEPRRGWAVCDECLGALACPSEVPA